MILIGLGGNLPSPAGEPRHTYLAALARLESAGIAVLGRSPWYESAPVPVPVSDQPWFINGVARLDTDLEPAALLEVLHQIEASFGRRRHTPNASRTLDLDLLAYNDVIREQDPPILPHPRLHERAFVLLPLKDVAPSWRHPVLGLTPAAMLEKLPAGQRIRPLAGLSGI